MPLTDVDAASAYASVIVALCPCIQIRMAKDVAGDILKQQQSLHKRISHSSSQAAGVNVGDLLSPAPVLFSLKAIQVRGVRL